MKKTALIAALVLCMSLTACGTQPAQSAASGSGEQSLTEQKTEGFVFRVRGAEVAVNDDMAEVLEAIGQPASYFEAASCAFEGLDKTYTYAGFVITTRPEGEKDFVNSILLTDDSVTTAEGSYLGCGKDAVLAAYGDQGEDLGTVVAYTRGGCKLNFIIAEEKVVSIEYLPA